MVGEKTRRFRLLVVALLTLLAAVIGNLLTESLLGQQSWLSRLGWFLAGIMVIYLLLRWQSRSLAESPEAIERRVSQLEPELRRQVQARSYGARSERIEVPLGKLKLDVTPRVGWVRDPRLVEPEPASKKISDDIVAAFKSSKRRLLIVGEPGSGKTMAAYSLIEHLDDEGDKQIPLLVNLSAWEAQENFEAFLVDYLCSEVGYQVRQRAVADAFISSRRYSLILDGLDEIPVGLRTNFSERLDKFTSGLPTEVAVVVTCRTREYEELRAKYGKNRAGLGLVQAVEILPLSSEQLDNAFEALAKFDDNDWGTLLSQRHLRAQQRVRQLLRNPLFLNLAVVGDISPGQLLDWTTTEQELRDLVLDRYLDRTLQDQEPYEPADARRYLAWIARFLSGTEVSPFGLKTADFTVFDLASLTPLKPPWRYRLFVALFAGLLVVLLGGLSQVVAWVLLWGVWEFVAELYSALVIGSFFGLAGGLFFMIASVWVGERSAVSSRLIVVWPSTRQQRAALLGKLGRGLIRGLLLGLLLGLVLGGLHQAPSFFRAPSTFIWMTSADFLVETLVVGLVFGLVGALVGALGGLVEPRAVLVTSRTPKEPRSRSLIAALVWLCGGLVIGLCGGLVLGLVFGNASALQLGLAAGLVVGLFWGLNAGGWFLLLQKVAHRRLARAGNLPPHPYDFLERGIERQIFRQVGGGVRFRHNLIQQHLASTSESVS